MITNRHGVMSHMAANFNNLSGLSGLITSRILFCYKTARLVLDKVELQQYSKHFTPVSPTSQHSTEASRPSAIHPPSVLYTFLLNCTVIITVSETTKHKNRQEKVRSTAVQQHGVNVIGEG